MQDDFGDDCCELVKCIFGIVLKYFILNVQGQGVT